MGNHLKHMTSPILDIQYTWYITCKCKSKSDWSILTYTSKVACIIVCIMLKWLSCCYAVVYIYGIIILYMIMYLDCCQKVYSHCSQQEELYTYTDYNIFIFTYNHIINIVNCWDQDHIITWLHNLSMLSINMLEIYWKYVGNMLEIC